MDTAALSCCCEKSQFAVGEGSGLSSPGRGAERCRQEHVAAGPERVVAPQESGALLWSPRMSGGRLREEPPGEVRQGPKAGSGGRRLSPGGLYGRTRSLFTLWTRWGR